MILNSPPPPPQVQVFGFNQVSKKTEGITDIEAKKLADKMLDSKFQQKIIQGQKNDKEVVSFFEKICVPENAKKVLNILKHTAPKDKLMKDSVVKVINDLDILVNSTIRDTSIAFSSKRITPRSVNDKSIQNGVSKLTGYTAANIGGAIGFGVGGPIGAGIGAGIGYLIGFLGADEVQNRVRGSKMTDQEAEDYKRFGKYYD